MSFGFDPTPLSLTSVIIEVLKNFFVDGDPYTYVPGDPVKSTISILEANQFKSDEIQKRPALITRREDIQVSRRCIGDEISTDRNGNISFYVNYAGSFSVNCIAMLPQEAEELAREALECLLIFQTLISRDFNFLTFQVVGIGTATPNEEYKESFIVPIRIIYEIAKTWEIIPQALPIKRIITVMDKNLNC